MPFSEERDADGRPMTPVAVAFATALVARLCQPGPCLGMNPARCPIPEGAHYRPDMCHLEECPRRAAKIGTLAKANA